MCTTKVFEWILWAQNSKNMCWNCVVSFWELPFEVWSFYIWRKWNLDNMEKLPKTTQLSDSGWIWTHLCQTLMLLILTTHCTSICTCSPPLSLLPHTQPGLTGQVLSCETLSSTDLTLPSLWSPYALSLTISEDGSLLEVMLGFITNHCYCFSVGYLGLIGYPFIYV